MIKVKFDEFIAQQTADRMTDESEADRGLELDEWLEQVDFFYSVISSYLKEYIDRDQITLRKSPLKIFEERIGEYSTWTITLLFGSKQIKFEPIGTNLIGARGRIDLLGPNGKVKFVLVDSMASSAKDCYRTSGEDAVLREAEREGNRSKTLLWKIATPPPHSVYLELNEESFLDALMEVANA